MRDGLLLGGFLVGVLMSSVFVTEPIFSPGECNEIIESVNKYLRCICLCLPFLIAESIEGYLRRLKC